ncbi:MAG: hypothetical protein Kow0062_18860 [Acidobacteriota bacterium]
MRLITIGAGEERSGRTLLAAGLGAALARLGAGVVLVDLDLRAADLHLVLGMPHPRKGVGDVLARGTSTLASLAVPVPGHENLRLVAGSMETVRPSALRDDETARLAAGLASVDADFVIADLPSGVTAPVLELLLGGDLALIVTRPSRASAASAARLARLARIRRSARSPVPEPRPERPRVYTSLDDLVRDMNAMREQESRRLPGAARQALVVNRLPADRADAARAELVTQLAEEEGPAAGLPILGTLPEIPDLESTLPAVFDGQAADSRLGQAIDRLARRIRAEFPTGDEAGRLGPSVHEALLV